MWLTKSTVRRGLLALLCGVMSACGQAPPEPEPAGSPFAPASNILLLTIDTLRADHLSAYGYHRDTSPILKRLADEGVRFDQAGIQWPKTGPSFASMMTSTYPSDNGIVRKVGIEMPCSFRMLAERLQEAGYATYAVVSNGALASEFRFDQGFDVFVESWKVPPPEPGGDPTNAAAVNALVAPILDRIDTSKPYFLWVHYLDPHAPYMPPEGWQDRFQEDEFFDPSETFEVSDRPKQQVVKVGYKLVLESRTDLAFYRARYDAEIAYADQHIGHLLDDMKQRGLMDRTLTVVSSDHGESLGEHSFFFDHGRFGFQTCARVPLIFHDPHNLAPRVVDEPVALIDLAPTLLQAAGVEVPAGKWMQGRSLAPYLMTGQRASDGQTDVVFTEAGNATQGLWQRIVRDRRFKLIYAQTPSAQQFIAGKGNPWALYDLEQDPGETVNVAEQYPADFERLKALLMQHTDDEPFDAKIDTNACSDSAGMTAETEALLKSLGYL